MITTRAIFNQLDRDNSGILNAFELPQSSRYVGLDIDAFDGVIKKRVPIAELEKVEAQIEALPPNQTAGDRVAGFFQMLGLGLLQVAILPLSILGTLLCIPIAIAATGHTKAVVMTVPWLLCVLMAEGAQKAFGAQGPSPSLEADELARSVITA